MLRGWTKQSCSSARAVQLERVEDAELKRAAELLRRELEEAACDDEAEVLGCALDDDVRDGELERATELERAMELLGALDDELERTAALLAREDDAKLKKKSTTEPIDGKKNNEPVGLLARGADDELAREVELLPCEAEDERATEAELLREAKELDREDTEAREDGGGTRCQARCPGRRAGDSRTRGRRHRARP
ncbi:hypothetical protein C8R43DRAFT_961345 [Mycena crocata]|nr:hypothetical protein C8R43DRAFT_961345 [Mycena crocata]